MEVKSLVITETDGVRRHVGSHSPHTLNHTYITHIRFDLFGKGWGSNFERQEMLRIRYRKLGFIDGNVSIIMD